VVVKLARLMPRVESLREYEWDPLPASYDGRWEIVSGTYMNGYSVTTNYPRREDRIVTIQGNRMRVPLLAIPAGDSVREWTDYRVVYDAKTRRLYRIIDAVNGDSYVEYPYQISKRAQQFEMLSTLATRRTQPWMLRKLHDDPETRSADHVTPNKETRP